MSKTATLTIKIEPELKTEVEFIFKALGISTGEAITLFLNKVKKQKRLPFQTKIPNKETLQVFQDSDKGENMVTTTNLDDLYIQLGI